MRLTGAELYASQQGGPLRQFLVDRETDVGMPQRAIRGVPIDTAQHQRLVRGRGQIAMPELRAAIHDDEFKAAPRVVQENRTKTLFERAGQQAAAEIIESDPVLRLRVEQVARERPDPEDVSMRRGFFSPALAQ
jgi:hypothetical protein